jgi:hypothetical protein
VIELNVYTRAADVFSFGIFLCEVVKRDNPYVEIFKSDEEEILQGVRLQPNFRPVCPYLDPPFAMRQRNFGFQSQSKVVFLDVRIIKFLPLPGQ